MVKQSKVLAVASIAEKLERAGVVVLTDFRGLTVGDMTALRKKLREEKVECLVVKNRLAKLALKKAGCDSLDEILTGPTAFAFGYEDPATPARVIFEFAKKNERLKPKGGLLEGKKIDLETLGRLSRLPSREVLLGRLVGSLQSPATMIAISLKQVASNLVRALRAAAEKGEAKST